MDPTEPKTPQITYTQKVCPGAPRKNYNYENDNITLTNKNVCRILKF